MIPNLYEKLGGDAAVDATVDEFYKRVLADPILRDFFKNTDMKRQHDMQKKFLKHVFGGRKYLGRSMRKAHQGLGIKAHHFDAVAKHLQESLISLGVAQELVDEVVATAATTRNDVLGIDDTIQEAAIPRQEEN
jgi:hemoglobin